MISPQIVTSLSINASKVGLTVPSMEFSRGITPKWVSPRSVVGSKFKDQRDGHAPIPSLTSLYGSHVSWHMALGLQAPLEFTGEGLVKVGEELRSEVCIPIFLRGVDHVRILEPFQ